AGSVQVPLSASRTAGAAHRTALDRQGRVDHRRFRAGQSLRRPRRASAPEAISLAVIGVEDDHLPLVLAQAGIQMTKLDARIRGHERRSKTVIMDSRPRSSIVLRNDTTSWSGSRRRPDQAARPAGLLAMHEAAAPPSAVGR